RPSSTRTNPRTGPPRPYCRIIWEPFSRRSNSQENGARTHPGASNLRFTQLHRAYAYDLARPRIDRFAEDITMATGCVGVVAARAFDRPDPVKATVIDDRATLATANPAEERHRPIRLKIPVATIVITVTGILVTAAMMAVRVEFPVTARFS